MPRQSLQDANKFMDEHVPDSKWQRIIEAKIAKCIDPEKFR